ITGDFGNSFISGKPVIDDIASKMWISFWIAFIAMVLQVLIAVPLGVIAATKQYSATDYSVTVVSLMGISLPGFFFAITLQLIFAIYLQWLPLQGMVTARNHQFMNQFQQMMDIL